MCSVGGLHVASFPGLPRFCSLVCVQYNTWSGRMVKNGEGLGTLITWMMSVGRKLDVGGRGPCLNNILDFIIKRFITMKDPTCSHHREYSAWQVRNLLSGLSHIFLLRNCPSYVHLGSTSCDKCSQAFPILGHSSASMYYTERKLKNRNVGGLKTRLIYMYM